MHVIGTGGKEYVLLDFLTALWFCSMFRFRGDPSQVRTKSGPGKNYNFKSASGTTNDELPRVDQKCDQKQI